MKVALLISGYYRSFKSNLQNIKAKMLQDFRDVDIYLHITKNELTEDKYLNVIGEDDYKTVERELSPVCILKENNVFFAKNSLKNNTFNAWFKFFKLNEIKKANELVYGKYDLVIKTRPDLFLDTPDWFKHPIDDNTIYVPTESLIDKQKLHKAGDPTICDAFAYGRSEAMDNYFNIFKQLNELSNSFGYVSETLLYFYLNQSCSYVQRDIKYAIILSNCNVFAICGDSGSGKTVLSTLLKENFSDSFTLECDRYHKWERGHPNWNSLTHLNPDSNYIAKMSKDIFDLKIGKTVYQVDYDHCTGRFTDKQQIKNSDTIIVCGLHSFYAPTNIYNLRIFMDTDESLKTKWKIQRDTAKRGYSKAEVLEAIEKRKPDFLRYVLPQKNEANLIVRFFPLDPDNERVGLELTIAKEFDLNAFHKILNKNHVPYQFEIRETSFVFVFTEFVPVGNRLVRSSKSLYDYIVLFVLESGFIK